MRVGVHQIGEQYFSWTLQKVSGPVLTAIPHIQNIPNDRGKCEDVS